MSNNTGTDLGYFNKISISGDINVQLIKTAVLSNNQSIKINYEDLKKVHYEIINETLHVSIIQEKVRLRRDSYRPWIGIKYSELKELKIDDFAYIRSEMLYDVKKIELSNRSELHLNNIMFTKDIDVFVESSSSFKIYSKNDFSKNIKMNLNVFDGGQIHFGAGKAQDVKAQFTNSLECDLSGLEIFNLDIEIATTRTISLNVFNNLNLSILEDLQSSYKIKNKQQANKTIYLVDNTEENETIYNEERKKPFKILKRTDLLKLYKINVEENHILTFLNNPYCFESLCEDNRARILDLILNMPINDRNLLNDTQKESIDKILFLYDKRKKTYRF